jgi:hypothetical protein
VGLSSSSNEYQALTSNHDINEEEAIRLLIDAGISPNKAKERLQVYEIYRRSIEATMAILHSGTSNK